MEVAIGRAQFFKATVIAGSLFGIHASIAMGWVIVPLASIVALSALALVANFRRRSGRLPVFVLLGITLFFSAGLSLSIMGWTGVGHVLTLPSFLVLAGLAFVFARSLARNEEPIVNRFMRLELEVVPERAASYGRTLTLVWAVLLAAMAVESVALSLLVDLSTWSWLVNVVNPVLLVVFFVGQHIYGDRFLPAHRRASPLSTVKAMLDPRVWFIMRGEQPRGER